MVYTLIFSTIGLSANYTHVNYVYNGTLLFILGGVATGFTPSLTERSLLLAGLTSREIWRVVIMLACATTALTAISMGCCAILDIISGNVRVVEVYMIQHTGIGPYLWFLVPMGAFPGVIASACMSMANRYLTSGGTAAVITSTILFMNPISYLIVPHAFRSGLLGYISYLLVAAVTYPLLLRFILSRPRNEK
jgi:membrane protein